VDVAAYTYPDKTITTNTEWCGDQFVGKLKIQGGAKVTCATGKLNVWASEVSIDPASSIDFSAVSGEASGSNANICSPTCVCDYGYTGASGGGNATMGGSSVSTQGDKRSYEWGGCLGSCVQFSCSGVSGGAAHGSANDLSAPGGGAGGTGCSSEYSCSGGALIPAGKGGGSIRIIATKSISIQGTIRADGSDGGSSSGGPAAGGGAGGSIVLVAADLSITGTLSAAGGKGGTGDKPSSYYNSNYAHGGAGGKGWVKLVYGSKLTNSGTVNGATIVTSVMPPIEIRSPTHPDPAKVYNDTFPKFDVEWTAPFAGVQGYWYVLNQSESFVLTPSNGTFTTDPKASFSSITFSKPGTWYFRVIAVDGTAINGTVSGRFTVNVNATPHGVASSSHPDPAKWYTNKAVSLSWTPPAGAGTDSFAAYWYRLDRTSNTSPANAKTEWTQTANPQALVSKDCKGNAIDTFTYHFHVVAEDTMGNLTKEAAHFRIQIGTDPGKTNYYGYIKDGATPLKDVQIRMEPYGLTATTDSNGYFLINSVVQGPYTLTGKKGGYKDLETSVTVSPDQVPVNLTMAPL
jgi:hypothetical protein